MSTSALSLLGQLRALLVSSGLPELVGGIEVFDAGLEELKGGVVVVAADLAAAERLGADLADAVLDPERFPHVARVHALISDLLEAEMPAELERWMWRIARAGPLPNAPELSRAIAVVAVAGANPFHRVLARFVLFELLCVRQRLVLKRHGVKLEILNGRRQDVEVLASAEVGIACVLAESSAGLLSVEDPLELIDKMAKLALARHVQSLQRELGLLSREVHEQLKRRAKILAAASRVEPADAVLIFNEAADEFGEERLTALQLKHAHPLLLDGFSPNRIYKRVERLPERVRNPASVRTRTFGDLMVEIMQEIEK